MKEKVNIPKVASLTGAHFVHDVYTAFLAPLLPKLIDKLNLSYFSVSLLQFFHMLPSFLMPFIGIIANKPYARYFVILSPAIAAVLMSMIGIVSSYFILVVILFVVGINSALFHVPAPVMMKNVSGKNTGLGMSMHMLGGEAARTLGPLIILGAVSYWSVEGIWRLFPFGVMASIVLFFLLNDVPVADPKVKPSTKRIMATFKRNRGIFALILGLTFFRAIMKSSLTTFLPVYIEDIHSDFELAVISLTVLEIGGVAGTLMSGIISDYFSRKKLLLIISIANPFLMILFIISGSTVMSFVILIILGFFVFATTPVVMAYVLNIKTHYPVFLNSIYMTISFAGSSVAILLIGFLADGFGLEDTYWIAAILAFGAIPFALKLPENKKDRQ